MKEFTTGTRRLYRPFRRRYFERMQYGIRRVTALELARIQVRTYVQAMNLLLKIQKSQLNQEKRALAEQKTQSH